MASATSFADTIRFTLILILKPSQETRLLKSWKKYDYDFNLPFGSPAGQHPIALISVCS